MMEFSVFAQRLKGVIGGGVNTAFFTKSLLDSVIPENEDILADAKTSTLKAYYNGRVSITKLANKIIPYLHMEGFQEYLEEYEDFVLQNIADEFKDVYPDINSGNCPMLLSELYESIIFEAAKATRKPPVSKPKKQTLSNDQQEIMDNMGQALLKFGKMADAICHKAAEESRRNKEEQEYTESKTDEGAATSEESASHATIIQNQVNVIQNGDHNANITNTGTLNLNL